MAPSDWEQRNQDRLRLDATDKEVVSQFPSYPRPAGLLEYTFPGSGTFRFYIDRNSLGVDASGGVVRYTLVARSPEGVDNVSYEGARCERAEIRVYALGRTGAWQPVAGPWRPATQRWHAVLLREYFCPQGVPIRNAAEAVRALENGGHPFHKGFGAEPYLSR